MTQQALVSKIPDQNVLLALEPEELAWVVLESLKAQAGDTQNRSENKLNRDNFIHSETVQGYPQDSHQAILKALSEAWSWLEREILVAHRPGEREGWVFITRRGTSLRTRTDFETFLKSKLLPKELLHPLIADKVWPLFIRGEYDTAVFQAFKEVEVTVRTAAGYPATDIGVPLMRKAFNVQTGPLSDRTTPEGERQALSDLFAGAVGSYKNPSSHRHVAIDPPETAEMIMLASHLLKIIDSRTMTTTSPPRNP